MVSKLIYNYNSDRDKLLSWNSTAWYTAVACTVHRDLFVPWTFSQPMDHTASQCMNLWAGTCFQLPRFCHDTWTIPP